MNEIDICHPTLETNYFAGIVGQTFVSTSNIIQGHSAFNFINTLKVSCDPDKSYG
jgi:hypothetical protein